MHLMSHHPSQKEIRMNWFFSLLISFSLLTTAPILPASISGNAYADTTIDHVEQSDDDDDKHDGQDG